jgi:hypothetical protein
VFKLKARELESAGIVEKGYTPVLGDYPESVRAPDELVQGLDYRDEAGPMSPFFLPAVQHQLVDCFGAIHRRW